MSGLYRFIYCESVPIYPPEILKKITLKQFLVFTFGILPGLRMECHSLATYSVHAETDNLF